MEAEGHTDIKGTVLRASAIFLFCLMGIAAAVMIHKAVDDSPCNHWGFDIRILWALSLAAVVWSMFAKATGRVSGMFIVATLAIAASFAILILFLDHYNLLVDYDVWQHRGMPSQWGRPLK